MESPILRLGSDVWTFITAQLSYEAIRRLITTGDADLIKAMGYGTRSLSFPTFVDCVDLNRVLATCQYLPNLQELNITPAPSYMPLKTPLQSLRFPPKLTSLAATFPHAAHFFLRYSDIATLAPGLLSLKLMVSVDDLPRMSDSTFPSGLTTLVLQQEPVLLAPGDIALLPRSLTHLSLATEQIPAMTSYEWPQHLAYLSIERLRKPVTLEHLPRTVIDLHLSRANHLTSFKLPEHSSENPHFPWRVFFPLLQRLTLKEGTVQAQVDVFLESVVSASVFPSAVVSSFIESGFWNLDGFEFNSKRVYPMMESILTGPSAYSKQMRDSDVFQRCSPLMTSLKDILSDHNVPVQYFELAPSMESYHDLFNPTPANWSSATLKSLKIGPLDPPAIKKFPGLTLLSSMGLEHDGTTFAWPSALTHLNAYSPFTEEMVRPLPATLTHLSIGELSIAAWSILATNLVNLRSLNMGVRLQTTWTFDGPLTPMASKSLEFLGISVADIGYCNAGRPYLHEFFGPDSPLPTSLTSLELNTHWQGAPVPMTICPYLPRQLRSLKTLRAMAWKFGSYKTEPHIASMTPAQLLASLPPHLTSLTYFHTEGRPETIDNETLRSLPPSLTNLYVQGLFSNNRAETNDRKDEIIALMPPGLSFLHCDTIDLRADYFKARRPDLYKVTTDNGEAQKLDNKALWGY